MRAVWQCIQRYEGLTSLVYDRESIRSYSLRRRANALNVSSRISLRWPIHIINPVDKTKLSCNTPTDAAPQFLRNLPPFLVWCNKLSSKYSVAPLQIRLSSSEAVFKANLKTYLFKRAFDL